MAELHIATLLAVLVASLVIIVIVGTLLARVGDEIAERTGLGRLFVGALFVAIATSLPELGTDIAAALSDAPDLAIGDLFGSSMANMAILAIVDLRFRGQLLPVVELGHARVAAVAIGLTSLAMLGIAMPSSIDIAGVGVTSIMLAAGYVAALAWFRRVPPIGAVVPTPTPFRHPQRFGDRWAGTGPLMRRFAGAALVLAIAAPALALTTEEVGHRSGISQGFLGVTLLATATSLPELATSLAAVKMGSFDLAVGNLLGSNVANMAMIFLVDIAYRPGPILSSVEDVHLVAGSGAVLLMALALASITSGQANRAQRLEPDSIVLLVAYAGAITAVALAT
ncbi:MAG: sodium:calcium antiporter [Ilumatobacter sp.]|uniref:sodium:calcium antiporter n=1 Tax=Ilumatobacter sp. TaxID=1967498 RepID=UPI0039194E9D